MLEVVLLQAVLPDEVYSQVEVDGLQLFVVLQVERRVFEGPLF